MTVRPEPLALADATAPGGAGTITRWLQQAAAAAPAQVGYTILPTGAGVESELTYAALDRQARALAAELQVCAAEPGITLAGAPVLIVLPAGADFLAAFFGALYARAIAVPTRFPGRDVASLTAIATDCYARFGITTTDAKPVLERALPAVRWLTTTARSDAAAWRDPGADAGDIAYLQYTSGSTAAPKGVVVRHRNVLANCNYISRAFDVRPDSRFLTWLPHFHDLGLIFGLLAPLAHRCPSFVMAPMAFAQSPLRWLERLSQHRITHCAAPNFAYQACLEIEPERLAGLDLSAWRVALNGAEPVRAGTVEAFARRFGPYGFASAAMCPGYGLAEATLVATACGPARGAVVRKVDAARLSDGVMTAPEPDRPVSALVGCGRIDPAVPVVIADPETGRRCSPGRVGEIWLAGPSMTGGYWENAAATARKFGARLDGETTGPFLRSGDLGVIENDELFVLGRLDDMIVIRGTNYVPDDLELTVEQADPALSPGGGIVVALDIEDEPRVIVLQEIARQALRGLDAEGIVRAIVRAVSERHQLEVAAVVLLKPRGLPRTHSGKKRRHAGRRRFRDGTLDGLHRWLTPRFAAVLEAGAAPSNCESSIRTEMPMHAPTNAPSSDSIGDLLGWLRAYADERLNSRLIDERRTIPPYVVLDLGNRGVLGLQAPRAHGGLALGNRDFARVLEQLSAIDLTVGSFVTVNNCLGVRPILRHATAKRRDELLPLLASGRELAAFAMTEPGAGSNVRGIAAEARPADGGWALWGTKLWSGSAAWAGSINTFVRLDEGPAEARRGVTGFVLRQGSPGLRMGPEALTMGLRGMVQNEVRLEGVRVTPDDLLGTAGDGMTVAMETMEFGRFSIAALSVGVIKRCLQLMVRHAGRRSIATGKLIGHPVTLARISELSAAVSAVEALVGAVAGRLDDGLPVPAELYCACKTTGPEFAWRAADLLMQQMAGRGYIESNIAPQILRDTRILRIFEGPSEPMYAHIGARLMHRPDELRRLIAEEWQQPTLAAELEVAAARIVERCSGVRGLADAEAARQWAMALAGKVGALGILLAAVRQRRSPALRRTEEWARLAFDRRLAEALGQSPAEAVLLDAGEAERMVTDYADSIGDIEQGMADELRTRDVFIARDSAETASPMLDAKDDTANAPPAAPANDAGDAIVAWLAQWLAQTFERPAGTIGATDLFSEFGMDSVRAMMLITALEDRTGADLSPTLIWDYPSLGALAAHVAALKMRPAAATAADHSALLAEIERLSPDEMRAMLERLPEA